MLRKPQNKQSMISPSLTTEARLKISIVKANLKRKIDKRRLMKTKKKMSRKSSKSRNCLQVT